MSPAYTNSEGERISIGRAQAEEFEGQPCLIIHDDLPPLGSGIAAPMLLDQGTRDWLRAKLDELEAADPPNDELPPPKKRYTTTIVIDHHDGDHLAKALDRILMNDTIEWDRKEGMPYVKSVGSDRVIRHVEHDDYVPEADYEAALIEWHRATRKAREGGPTDG